MYLVWPLAHPSAMRVDIFHSGAAPPAGSPLGGETQPTCHLDVESEEEINVGDLLGVVKQQKLANKGFVF